MASDVPTFFSTDEADECFMNEFVLASSFVLEGDVSQASELYESVGMNWAVAEKKLTALGGPAAHEPSDDSSLVEDVRFAVEHTLEQLWAQHSPKVKGKNLSARRVPLKMPAIVAAYSKQVLKIDVAAKKQQARESPGMEGTTGGSFLDKLAARLDGTSQETQVPDAEKPPTGSGKGQGLPQRAPEVSSLLQHAAARLMNPGPPPLRQAERWGAMIAQHILQEKSSITDWVDRENLTGHTTAAKRAPLREPWSWGCPSTARGTSHPSLPRCSFGGSWPFASRPRAGRLPRRGAPRRCWRSCRAMASAEFCRPW